MQIICYCVRSRIFVAVRITRSITPQRRSSCRRLGDCRVTGMRPGRISAGCGRACRRGGQDLAAGRAGGHACGHGDGVVLAGEDPLGTVLVDCGERLDEGRADCFRTACRVCAAARRPALRPPGRRHPAPCCGRTTARRARTPSGRGHHRHTYRPRSRPAARLARCQPEPSAG